ncbi:MAG: DUF4157 domain-containing protein, partial [Elainellaceae cyanobacterium]
MGMRSQVPAQATQTSDTPTQMSVANRAESDLEQDAQPSPLAGAIAAPQGVNFKQNFSRVPIRPSPFPVTPLGPHISPIQPKLRVGAVGDRYEQEADRVADQVMRMPEPSGRSPSVRSQAPQSLQRQTVASEMTVSEQEDEEDVAVQTKSNAGSAIAAPDVEMQLKAGRGGGQPLNASTSQFMASRFSHDFGNVRVHTDSRAAQMNQRLNAQAFTHGQHLYFGQGQYQPQTRSGQRLIAHELTHVVQQTGGRRIKPNIQLGSKPPQPISPVPTDVQHLFLRRAAGRSSTPFIEGTSSTATPNTPASTSEPAVPVADNTFPQGGIDRSRFEDTTASQITLPADRESASQPTEVAVLPQIE